MRSAKPRSEQPLLHVVEEASELLRRLEPRAWAWWLGGTSPFICVLLHFWTDMSRAADAWEKLPSASLLLALAYWWMKLCHCVFSNHLLHHLRGEPVPSRLNWRARLRFASSQALIHATAPWILLLSLVAMLPFGWAYAFYHNVTVLALSHFRAGGRTRGLIAAALQQAHFRQGQNHGLMMMLLIFGIMVWMNGWAAMLQFGGIARSFTGEDNFITRNPMAQLSSTVFAATMALAYLLAGPLVKALYAVRCFYGQSRKNGEDIAVAFRHAGAVTLALLLMLVPGHAAGPSTPASPPPSAVQLKAPVLDEKIREVLQQDSFQWRMPRDATAQAEAEKGWLAGFIDTVSLWFKSVKEDLSNRLEKWMKEIIKSLLGNRTEPMDKDAAAATPWADVAQLVLRGLLVLLGLVLAILLIRQWRRQPPPAARTDAAPEINLASEHVVASQLPENEWLRLAQEKREAGDYRLAMRALFLATLAHLGERRLLAIVKSKSNGDYVRELRLRARDRRELQSRFTDSVRHFDRAWYGWHAVSRDQLDHFRSNHQHIVTDAG